MQEGLKGDPCFTFLESATVYASIDESCGGGEPGGADHPSQRVFASADG